MPHNVALLAYDQLCTFEFASAAEVLRYRPAMFEKNWYRLSVCTLEAAPIRTDAGLIINFPDAAETLTRADTIVIPGWRIDDAPPPPRMLEELVAASCRGARIVSICTGAFVLAAAGLLNGRRATTHWRYASRLASDFPLVQVDPTVLYVDEGEVVTSAGSAAGLDMLLYLIRKDYGAAACNAVAREMVVPPHRDGGQVQFIQRPVPRHEGTAFSATIEYLRQKIHQQHKVSELAGRAAMSPRSFFRRFKEATGYAPYEWVLRERIELAKDLLEETELSVEQIAHRVGFGGSDTLRHHFTRLVELTPSAFRNRFSGLPRTTF